MSAQQDFFFPKVPPVWALYSDVLFLPSLLFINRPPKKHFKYDPMEVASPHFSLHAFFWLSLALLTNIPLFCCPNNALCLAKNGASVKIIVTSGKIILGKMRRNLNPKWRCVNTSVQIGPGWSWGSQDRIDVFASIFNFLRFSLLNSGWVDSLNNCLVVVREKPVVP